MINIKNEVEAIYDQVVAWRRDFHMYPELGNHEKRTSKIVADLLRSFGLEVQEGVAGYGVVGLLRGVEEGRTIAIRADMDALPMKEENTFDYASKIDGVMHACGHDGHTANLLGTAAILSKMKNELKGNVKFIFQPAEEVNPVGGAKPMIEAGVLENPKVDAIISLHITSNIPSGTLEIIKGPFSTAGDSFDIELFGKSSHGAEPHMGKDALLAACQLVNSMQTIVSRQVDPFDTAVITVGKLVSGKAGNIVSDYTKIEGSVRTIYPKTQEKVINDIIDISAGIEKITGTQVKVNYHKGYPAVNNNSDIVDIIISASSKVLPEGTIVKGTKPIPASEDFSHYILSGIPGAMFLLGGNLEGKGFFSNHHPKFNWDENIMKIGMSAFCSSVIEYLNN